MGDELNQFQKDLLDSMREMNVERALRVAEVKPLAGEVGFGADVSSKLKNSDTLTKGKDMESE